MKAILRGTKTGKIGVRQRQPQGKLKGKFFVVMAVGRVISGRSVDWQNNNKFVEKYLPTHLFACVKSMRITRFLQLDLSSKEKVTNMFI